MISTALSKSLEIVEHNRRFLPGGVCSINRIVDPPVVFVRAAGAYMWDADGNRYIDYHAAFGPYLLGHNHPRINAAVSEVLARGASLFGTGTTILEGRLAELLCAHIQALERVAILNTGTEATAAAIRVARAATGREHVIVMQGGYNGQGDSLACNLMNSLKELGPRVSPGEYRHIPIGAGVTGAERNTTHAVNFNDLESVRYVCDRHPVAALITEPVLQNVGVVPPQPGYLQGLRALAERYGFILVFDEVKTGFRHALGGYSEISGVKPDLVVYGKAVANGFPLAILGGKRELMEYAVHPDPLKRPLLAGTYNGHPVPVAAAIATIECLLEERCAVYAYLERLGRSTQEGIESILRCAGITGVVSRIGSAYTLYLMDHVPRDWHDILEHHDSQRDRVVRRRLIESGVYFFPVACKQCSISAAHTDEDIAATLEKIEEVIQWLATSR